MSKNVFYFFVSVGIVLAFCACITLFVLIGEFLPFANHESTFLPFGGFILLLYVTSITLISTWVTHIFVQKLINQSHPLPQNQVQASLCFIKEVILRNYKHEKNCETSRDAETDGLKDIMEAEEEEEEQVQDELQCEVELLLNELHRLLISSWFDNVSPLDPDFPRATRQAFGRVAVELKVRMTCIESTKVAHLALSMATAHLSQLKANGFKKGVTPLEDGSAEESLSLVANALVASILPLELSSPPGGEVVASLLAIGALRRALSLVSSPGWLAMQIAQAITGDTINTAQVELDNQLLVEPVIQCEDIAQQESAVEDKEFDQIGLQEACTPPTDTPDLLPWPTELASSPKLWGACPLQPEQPSLPQIVEPLSSMPQPMKKASEAEWLNSSPNRQQLGLTLSKSSQDLTSQVSSSPFSQEISVLDDFRDTPGCLARSESSNLSCKVREAGSDVLLSLRARASHISALLSPARETPPPPPMESAQQFIEPEGLEDDVSPVYEEASDLASSIAKLRALLKEKSSTDDEETGQLEEAMHDNGSLTENMPVKWDIHSDTVDAEWMDEAEEAPELPDDGRPFMNVSIPATELSCDSSGQQFVQYCIQYDAVYVQEGEDGPRLVLQTTSVKRRFQEFLNLQNRLEEIPAFRSALRGVKGPSRWLALAFSKAGQQTTAARLPILERFLQQLCEQPVLSRSSPLKNFLAYGSQRALAFTKQGSELPRLDKILARTVSGVFQSIKTALPSFDFELSPASSMQHLQHGNNWGAEEVGGMGKMPSLLGLVSNRSQANPAQPFVFIDKAPQGRDIATEIKKFLATRIEPAKEAFSEDSSNKSMIYLQNFETSSFGVLKEDKKKALTYLVQDLLALLLPRCWLLEGPLAETGHTLLQEWTEERLTILADRVWSMGSAVCCLRACRAALAPGAPVLQTTIEEGRTALKAALQQVTPGWLQLFLGVSNVQRAQDMVLDTLCNERANQEISINLALLATYLLLSTNPSQVATPTLDLSRPV